MNTKAAVGLIAAIIVLVGVFFVVNHKAAAPVLAPAATTTPSSATTGAAEPSATTTRATPAKPVAAKPKKDISVDSSSLTTSSPRPTITGSAHNLSVIGYVIVNSAGVGIVGSSNIPVVNGRWSFTPPTALTPGSYTLHLVNGDAEVIAPLVISGS